MKINLLEIPTDGQTWALNRKTSQLNEALQDLIGETAYKAEFTILPLGQGNFNLTGFIRTEIEEECSRCALDFQLELSESFHELLMPALETPRDAHFTKANHFSDQTSEGPSVVEYAGHHFDAGEYFHEILALAIPTHPAPDEDAMGKCRVCQIPVRDRSFSFEEPVPVVESPFAALKKIKI